jgi:nitrate/nitrite transporter NarK
MKKETKPERPRKRWKRIVKWSAGVIFVTLVLVTFIAYWMSTNDCDRGSAAPNNPIKAIVHCEYVHPMFSSWRTLKSLFRMTISSWSEFARLQ